MQAICKGFGFPPKVAAAAVLLFKRFYLSSSALDHDPKNIMLTCIYLACKVKHACVLWQGLSSEPRLGTHCSTLCLPRWLWSLTSAWPVG